MNRQARASWLESERPSKVGRLALMAATLLVVVGCAELLPPPPPPPPPPPDGENHRQMLTVVPGVSAVQTTFAFDPDKVGFRGLSEMGAGVTAAANVKADGTAVDITVLSEAPLDGDVLSIHWVIADGAAAPPIEIANAYAADGSAANGGVSVGPLAGDTATDLVQVSVDLSEFTVGDAASAACFAATYQPAVADYAMGDVDRSGSVDVRDVLLAHTALSQGTIDEEDPFELFHHDLTGDCEYDQQDVEQLFMKVADAELAAKPVLKPAALTYADLLAGNVVLVGNAGREYLDEVAFEGENLNGSALQATFEWAIEGISGVWQIEGDPNDALGSLSVSANGATAEVRVGNVAILIAGQSNAVGWDASVPDELESPTAGVHMLGNDYVWKPATEPLDRPSGQVDCVSRDSSAGTSAGTSLGIALKYGHDAVTGTGRDVYLIPSALGASQVGPHVRSDNCVYPDPIGWNLGPDNLAGADRETLFGSAVYRALVSAGEAANPAPGEGSEGGPVSAVYWYQGESDNSSTSLRGAYSDRTEDVFDAFRSRLAAVTAAVDPVIIYAQLAPYGCCEGAETELEAEAEDLRSHDIAERQRRFEDAAYRVAAALDPSSGTSAGLDHAYMVVTHDLPRSDRIHLSAEAQMVLADRVALAYQEHLLGWEVDGTGPRITDISRSGNSVVITLDRDVDQTSSPGANGYSSYFTVYWGAPTGTNYDGYGGNELDVTDVRRDPNDPRRVVIQHEPPPGAGSIYVRYKRPYEPTDSSDYLEDVIRGEASGLPLPSFGPLRAD